MKDPNLAKGHLLAHKVNVNLNMLRALVVDRIGRHVDGADVVAEDHRSLGQLKMELLKELPQPTALGHNVSHSTVFCLSTRAGDRGLAFGGPGDQVVAEIDAEARSGPPGVRATSPVSIRVCGQRLDGAGANVKTGG